MKKMIEKHNVIYGINVYVLIDDNSFSRLSFHSSGDNACLKSIVTSDYIEILKMIVKYLNSSFKVKEYSSGIIVTNGTTVINVNKDIKSDSYITFFNDRLYAYGCYHEAYTYAIQLLLDIICDINEGGL